MTYVRFSRPAVMVLKGGLPPVDPDRPAAKRQSVRLRALLREMFAEAAPDIARQIAARVGHMHKMSDPIADILASIDFSRFVARIDPIADILAATATGAATTALDTIGASSSAVTAITTQYAVQAARARAAEMVGMRLLPDGSIVTNPNPVWAITEATRDMLRPLVATAIETGASADELRQAVEQSAAFDPYRAEMVARTEIITANNEAAMTAYKQSGVVQGKRWSTAGGPTNKGYPVSDECQACEDQGVIPLDAAFVTGRMQPPNHPHCRCVVIPVI